MTFIVCILFSTMSLESKQETTNEALLGTDLEQNVGRFFSEGVSILTKSKKFLDALANAYFNSSFSEGYLQLQLYQPIRIQSEDKSFYLIFSLKNQDRSCLLIMKRTPENSKDLCPTLSLELPVERPGQATLTYMEGIKDFTNTQTAVRKAEEFLKTLKQDLS